MNPNLARLRPCPFEKRHPLFVDVTPNPKLREIKLYREGLPYSNKICDLPELQEESNVLTIRIFRATFP